MHSLALRIMLQSWAIVLVQAALLSVSAGTLHYPAAWAYLGLNGVTMTATNFYLLSKDPALVERRVALGERGEPNTRQKLIVKLMGCLFLAMFVVAGLDRRMSLSHVAPALLAAAFAFVAAGIFVVFLALRENTYASSVVEVDAGHRVVATGPYRLSRHPMYAGFLLSGAATPLALGSYWAEALVVLLVPLGVMRLLGEERFLREHLRGYDAYMGKTPYRLIPGVW
jgi:protein-S-isoprenylcysteine O-methyltransferase Ste14